jgi:F-type H+-transporting ATPase subunit delta
VSTIAKRYASALVELARESDLIETFHEQFQTLHHIIEASSLEDFLSAPQISGSEKKALIDSTLGSFHPYVIRFLYVSIDKKRTSQLSAICAEVTHQLDLVLNIRRGVVKSPRLMDSSQLQVLVDALSSKWACKIILTNEVDPSLIGGYKIEIDDAILDGSLKGQLDELRSYLNQERRTTHGT